MNKHRTGKKEKPTSVSDTEPEPEPGKPGGETAAPPETGGAPEETPEKERRTGDEGLEDRLLRLQADFDNYRKRVQRDRGDWYQQANEDLITELLPILDHFEMGLHTAEKHHVDRAVIDGFQMVYNQLEQALAKYRLSPIEAEGRDFNPHLHEAITHVPSEEHPADTVIAQTRRGYKLGDKLLRPAQVVVSSGPPQEPAAPNETMPDAPKPTDATPPKPER